MTDDDPVMREPVVATREADRLRFEQTSWMQRLHGLLAIPSVALLVAMVPEFGFGPLVALTVPPAIGFGVVSARSGRRAPALAFVVSLLGFTVGLGVAATMTGGATSFLLVWAAVTPVVLYPRLRASLANVSAVLAFVTCVAIVLVDDFAGFRDDPWLLLVCTGSLGLLMTMASPMAAAELHFRAEATVDPLTGMLTRNGLGRRFAEMRDQAAVIGDDTPVAAVVCDIDHFKVVNDTHGHAAGDAVLQAVAYTIRSQLRRFELAYRLGGEEFLVLLPGHDLDAATETAERIRDAVEQCRPGGHVITVSAGVAAGPAATAAIDELVADADRALYAAKRNGRNQVAQA